MARLGVTRRGAGTLSTEYGGGFFYKGRKLQMLEITKGLIIGVGAGITTTFLVGVWRVFTRCGERREQIAYIRKIILENTEKIWSEFEFKNLPAGKSIPADAVRYVFFREFQTRLEVAISSRTNALSYKQISSLQNFISDIKRILTDSTLNEKKILPLPIFKEVYKQLEEEKWLRLPKRVDKGE